MTDYIKQAEKFLKDTNTIMEIIYDGMYSPRWENTISLFLIVCITQKLKKCH